MLTMIIGLDRNYRGKDLETQLHAQSIPYERVPGVLVAELPKSEGEYVNQAAARILLRRSLTQGEIGCSLAHRAAYGKLLDSKSHIGLVFEDDARLNNDIPALQIEAYLTSPEPRVLLLDWNPGWTVVRRKIKQTSSIFDTYFAPIDARAYALNRPAAALLMQGGSPIDYVADWPARAASAVRFSVMYPKPVNSDTTAFSSLEAGRAIQGETEAEGRRTKLLRLAATVTHVRWFRHRKTYGNYGTYFKHELLRLPYYAAARRANRRVCPTDPSSPLVLG